MEGTSKGKPISVPKSSSINLSLGDVAASSNSGANLNSPIPIATEYSVQAANGGNNQRGEIPNNYPLNKNLTATFANVPSKDDQLSKLAMDHNLYPSKDPKFLNLFRSSGERARNNINQYTNNSKEQMKSFEDQLASLRPPDISYKNTKQLLTPMIGKLNQQKIYKDAEIFGKGTVKQNMNMLKEGQMIPQLQLGALEFNWGLGLQPNSSFLNSNPEALAREFSGHENQRKRSHATISTHPFESPKGRNSSFWQQKMKVGEYPSSSQLPFIDLTNDEEQAEIVLSHHDEAERAQNTSMGGSTIRAMGNHIHFPERRVEPNFVLHAKEMKAMKEKISSLESYVGEVKASMENLMKANEHVSAMHNMVAKLPCVEKTVEIAKLEVEQCREKISNLEVQVAKDAETIESLKSSWEKEKSDNNHSQFFDGFNNAIQQVKFLHPSLDLSEVGPFKKIVDGKLVGVENASAPQP